MLRETVYNEIYDSQRHFRTILDSMSRPGKLNRFASVGLNPPVPLSKTAAYVGLALLNADVTYHAELLGADASEYLRVNTHSNPDKPTTADFFFFEGDDVRAAALIQEAKVGLPAYPESGATVVVFVTRLGKSSHVGGLHLELTGPGIETREIVFVEGLRPEILAMIADKNREFPLGVDAIFVSADETLLCLPRTTRVLVTNL
jgi:alpha-D-ribose 1-methylphosphonate 5-triphosphate synthase subunit PhnH